MLSRHRKSQNPWEWMSRHFAIGWAKRASSSAHPKPPARQPTLRHDSFGSRLIASWITEISEWLNEDYARSKGWTADEHEFIKAYVHSIIEGRVRSQIQQSISSAVTADFAQPQPNEATAWHASTVGSRIINQYVSSFGLAHEPAAIPVNQDAVKKKAGSSATGTCGRKTCKEASKKMCGINSTPRMTDGLRAIRNWAISWSRLIPFQPS